ncbi:putative histidinol-phosphatase [Zancudomyces culisetae]|uniref:Histidinol-phosphatase n=1 Tax=Zancudomyces culisetae TaxID=1213189 RepID=A0A1R1PKF5_ZANCU|nr:putative histidinol-phosphatase [Zancudomyces culisetae]|eukprot:OMH81419.1 putative histidinol-phosphatase [Zancudomyces culisetae]
METEWISNTENCNKHKCPKYTGSTALGGEQLVALRNHSKIDYVVGSLHHVKGIPIDFSVELYKQAIEAHDNDINKLFDAYYDEQYQMLVTVKPEIIGHFDLIRIFSHCIDDDTSENGVNSGVSYTLGSQTMQRIVRNIKYGIEIGALFEINSRAYKKGHEFAYPHPDILKIILDNGGKVTISDDSHSPSEIGLFYSKLFQYLKDMNISQIHYLDRDESTGVVKTLICDNILDESLWHHFHS